MGNQPHIEPIAILDVHDQETTAETRVLVRDVIEEDEPNEENEDLRDDEYGSPLRQQTRAMRNQVKLKWMKDFVM
ncbi:unnamed protein product [Sphenostylis stenocarpa]|uniref:Uncharacterized protein n=1 Tax=Sphenostylis stenocarpa TaxID=92480 RepID=A0AA86S2Y1_9FABA|nr:unnamed protein product [Sphenostylis stenocarpa]